MKTFLGFVQRAVQVVKHCIFFLILILLLATRYVRTGNLKSLTSDNKLLLMN
jgi:hypothetical protein